MPKPVIPRWEGETMQLSRLASEYIRTLRKNPDYSSQTADKYEDELGEFVAYVRMHGQDSVRDFTADRVLEFVQHVKGRGVGNSSIAGKLAALGSMAKYGMQTKGEKGKYLLDQNPLDRVPRPKKKDVPIRFLSPGQLDMLLAVDCQPNERLALTMLADQPLRATEWATRKVKDLILREDGGVSIGVKVKGGRLKTKRLGEDAGRALLASLKQREAGPEETLLLNCEGKPYTRQTLSEMVARLSRRAGLPERVSAHVIRHSVASEAAANGASVYEIAEMLNHGNLQTAHRYIHGVREDAALTTVRERRRERLQKVEA